MTKPVQQTARAAADNDGSIHAMVTAVVCVVAMVLIHFVYPDEFDDINKTLTSWMPHFFLSQLIYAMSALSLVDCLGRFVFRLPDANTSWYLVHFLLNMEIVRRALPSLVFCFANPTHVHQGFPLGEWRDTTTIAIALHIYHVMAYKCTVEDYLHHGISAGGVGLIGCTQPWGHIINTTNFFICGFPGGFDYMLLFLRKLGFLEAFTEKRINLFLNLLLRWPGIVLSMYMANVSKASEPAAVGWLPILLVTALHGSNAAFYCQKVVGNFHVVKYKRQQQKDAKQE